MHPNTLHRHTLIAISALWLLGGCGSAPEIQRYLLGASNLQPQTAGAENTLKVVVGQVEVAPFLAGSGLVQFGVDNTVHEAHYHRWAEPLPSQLQRQLRTELQQHLPHLSWLPVQGSAALQSLDYRIDVTIDSFHLDADSQAQVSGQWQLRNAQQGYVAHGNFAQRQALDNDGYAAMVDALQVAWQASLVEIAQRMDELLPPKRSPKRASPN